MSGPADQSGEVVTEITAPTIIDAAPVEPEPVEPEPAPETPQPPSISIELAPHPASWRIGSDDTLESIAAAAYGDVAWADAIQRANSELVPVPGILPIGKTLALPD